jgi:hypothetical protein
MGLDIFLQVAIHNLASFTAPRTQESFDENFAAQSVTGGKTPLSAEAPEGGSAHLQRTGQQFNSQADVSALTSRMFVKREWQCPSVERAYEEALHLPGF